jgi:hypothetical protein
MPKGKSTKKHHRSEKRFSLGIIAGLLPAAIHLKDAYKVGGLPAMAQHTAIITTGYDPVGGTWGYDLPIKYLYGPLLMGGLAHKLAGKFGINRMIRRSGIPYIEI